MSWNPGQQAMLEAMGYTIYRQAGAAAIPAIPAMAAADPGQDRLLAALRRAAGGRDPGALLPPLEQLRASAAAKRALWPRLRALRRS